MPTPAFCSIHGLDQGLITEGAGTEESIGAAWIKGHENESMVQAFMHQVTIPRDFQSGSPTGQRVHEPAIITKVYDKASPLIYNALTSGEMLDEVVIRWYRTNKQGKQEHYFTHTLKNALVVDVKAIMYNCQDPAKANFTHLEEVSFTYGAITWNHVLGKTQGDDDWNSPKSDD